MGNVRLLLADVANSAEHRNRLDEIHRAAARGANLVSQLLAFSRRQVMVRRVVDLNLIVAELQPLLEPADRRTHQAAGRDDRGCVDRES